MLLTPQGHGSRPSRIRPQPRAESLPDRGARAVREDALERQGSGAGGPREDLEREVRPGWYILKRRRGVFRLFKETPRFRDNRNKLNKSKQCLQEPWFGMTDLISERAVRVSSVLRPTRSVAKDLMKLFDDDRLMLAMSFQTKYLGMSPFNCPSLFTMLAFLEYEYGIFHPMGGLGNVSATMADIAKGMGVDFRMEEEVTEVIMDKKTIKGIVTKNGEFAGSTWAKMGMVDNHCC